MLLFVKITKETINLVIKENYLLFIKIDRKDREGISWLTKLQLSDSLYETVLNDLWINLQFIRLVFVDSKKEISVTFDTVTWGKKSCWSDTLLIISKIGLSFQAVVKIVACTGTLSWIWPLRVRQIDLKSCTIYEKAIKYSRLIWS